MNRVRVITARRRRVYTTCATWLLALLTLVAPAARAQTPVDLTLDPRMVKGPPRAPVTIVEFSDYQ